MRDDDRRGDRGDEPLAPLDRDDAVTASSVDLDNDEESVDPFNESLGEEIAALIDDGRTYASAEIAFQKTRAKLGGRSVGAAIGLLVVAAITLHIAILALAVGLVFALQPLVTIWGAISVVVGVLLAITAWLALKAKAHASTVRKLFGSQKSGADE